MTSLKYFTVDWYNEGSVSYRDISHEKTILKRNSNTMEIRTYIKNKIFTKFELKIDRELLDELFTYIEDLFNKNKLQFEYSSKASLNSSWTASYILNTGETLRISGHGKYPSYVKTIEKYVRTMFSMATESSNLYKNMEGPILFG